VRVRVRVECVLVLSLCAEFVCVCFVILQVVFFCVFELEVLWLPTYLCVCVCVCAKVH